MKHENNSIAKYKRSDILVNVCYCVEKYTPLKKVLFDWRETTDKEVYRFSFFISSVNSFHIIGNCLELHFINNSVFVIYFDANSLFHKKRISNLIDLISKTCNNSFDV